MSYDPDRNDKHFTRSIVGVSVSGGSPPPVKMTAYGLKMQIEHLLNELPEAPPEMMYLSTNYIKGVDVRNQARIPNHVAKGRVFAIEKPKLDLRKLLK